MQAVALDEAAAGQPHQSTASLLQQCAQLQRSKDAAACLEAAQQVLAQDTACGRAWAYVGWALFEQRLADRAWDALDRALKAPDAGAWSQRERFGVESLLQACSLLNSLSSRVDASSSPDDTSSLAATNATEGDIPQPCTAGTADVAGTAGGRLAGGSSPLPARGSWSGGALSPGDRLRSGWFSQRLWHLLQEGRLAPAGGGADDCDILGGPPPGTAPLKRPPLAMAGAGTPAPPQVAGRAAHASAASPCSTPDEEVGAEILHLWATEGDREIYFGNGGERSVEPGMVHPFPCAQARGGMMFLKGQPLMLSCFSHERWRPEGEERRSCYQLGTRGPCRRCRQRFPSPSFAFPLLQLPADSVAPAVQQPSDAMDVFYVENALSDVAHSSLVAAFDRLGRERRDFPVPKYHNIIDPNIGAMHGVWVPTGAEVLGPGGQPEGSGLESAEGAAPADGAMGQGSGLTQATARLADLIPDLDPYKHPQVYRAYNNVLTAALPMLAKLTRPALLLPGPLQVVPKAQRIMLAAGEDYEGVWHEDGMNEHIVAVILYYYRASPTLKGGALEFCSKEVKAVGTGDCGTPYLQPDEARTFSRSLQHCKVPVKGGTLVVFSNFAAVHRVLPMSASDDEPGSRDFLALFVVDQRRPLLNPPLAPLRERTEARGALLYEQLQPRGQFGVSSSLVYSTGNGCLYDLGWIADKYAQDRTWGDSDGEEAAVAKIERLNIPPPLDRGLSWTLEHSPVAGWKWDPDGEWEEHCIGIDWQTKSVFVHGPSGEVALQLPEGQGVCGVRYFDSRPSWAVEWQQHCPLLWTQENDLWEFLGD